MITKNLKNPFHSPGSKLLFFPDELYRFKLQKWVQPIAVEIQPSERCSHSCPHCQSEAILGKKERHRKARKGAFLELSLLESLWEAPPKGIILSGNTGDPLSHPNFDKLLTHLRCKNCSIALITNGHLLNEKYNKKIVKSCRGVRISLDASNKTEYAVTHGTSANWKRTLNNLFSLLHFRNSEGISSSECSIGVGFLTGILPPESLLAATQLSIDIGVDYIHFRPLHGYHQMISKVIKKCQRIGGTKIKVFSSKAKYKRNIKDGRRYKKCDAGNFFSLIDALGNVYFCCHHVGVPEACIGSLYTTSWKQILQSPLRQEIIEQFPKPSCPPLCRLHDHNEFIVDYLKTKTSTIIEKIPSVEFSNHAVFL